MLSKMGGKQIQDVSIATKKILLNQLSGIFKCEFEIQESSCRFLDTLLTSLSPSLRLGLLDFTVYFVPFWPIFLQELNAKYYHGNFGKHENTRK